MLTSLRLFTRAPCTRIMSWVSAMCGAGVFEFVFVAARVIGSPSVGRGLRRAWGEASAQLLDAEQVAGGVAEGAITYAVRLVDRLLDDFGVARLQLLEDS